MEINAPTAPQGNMRHFTVLVVLTQVLGLAAVALTAVWMGYYNGGFAWQSNICLELNYHPLLMIIGMVFLYADAILSFRVFHAGRKVYNTILHTSIHILVVVFTAVGLKAVVDMHNLQKPPVPNFYSFHSWLGLATLIMYGSQWLVGFTSFLFPKLGLGARTMVMPLHRFFGMTIFCMAVATALLGILEVAFMKLEESGYLKKPPVAMLLNTLSLVLVALAVLVIYIVSRPEYQRQPEIDEEHKVVDREEENTPQIL